MDFLAVLEAQMHLCIPRDYLLVLLKLLHGELALQHFVTRSLYTSWPLLHPPPTSGSWCCPHEISFWWRQISRLVRRLSGWLTLLLRMCLFSVFPWTQRSHRCTTPFLMVFLASSLVLHSFPLFLQPHFKKSLSQSNAHFYPQL